MFDACSNPRKFLFRQLSENLVQKFLEISRQNKKCENKYIPHKCPQAKTFAENPRIVMHWFFWQTYPISIFRFCFRRFDNVAMGCDTATTGCYTTNSNIILFLFRFAKNIFYWFWNAHFNSLVFHTKLWFFVSNLWFFFAAFFFSAIFLSLSKFTNLSFKNLSTLIL